MASPFRDPRTGILYFRRAVPKALRPYLGNLREVKNSLETRDPDVARARFPAFADECEKRFARARRQLAASDVGGGAQMVDNYLRDGEGEHLFDLPKKLVRQEIRSLKALSAARGGQPYDEDAARTNFGPPPADEILGRHILRAEHLSRSGSSLPMLETLERLDSADNFEPIHSAIIEIAKANGRSAAPGSELYKSIGRSLLEALYFIVDRPGVGMSEIEMLSPPILEHAVVKTTNGAPTSSEQRVDAEATPHSDPTNDQPLSKIFEAWAEDHLRKKGVQIDRTVDEWRRNIRQFTELHGDIDVRLITPSMVREFRKIAKNLPVKPKKRIAALPLRDQIQAAADEDLPTWQPSTVNKALSAIRVCLEFAKEDLEIIETNPAASVKSLPKEPYEDSRLAFDDEDLELIFRYPRLVDSTGISGLTLLWLLLLGAFTGCRLGELGRLRPANIRRDQGIWLIAIERDRKKQRESESEAKRNVKTNSSLRDIPIHSFLIELGFLDYVESQKDQDWLFPDLRADKYGTRTTRASRVFNEYLDSIGITDSEKVFHSFRHLLRRRMRGRGVEELADLIAGHAGSGVGRRYGRGADLPILKEFVDTISYDVIDWSPTRALLAEFRPSSCWPGENAALRIKAEDIIINSERGRAPAT